MVCPKETYLGLSETHIDMPNIGTGAKGISLPQNLKSHHEEFDSVK